MGKPVIQAIFFDFGNVCATFDFDRFIENFGKAANVPPSSVRAALQEKRADNGGYGGLGYSPLFAALECGEIDPAGFFRAFTRELGCDERIDYATFAWLWADIWLCENRELNELLHKIPQKKFLLSNTNAIVHGRYISDCTIIRNHFPTQSDRVLSYRVGAIKPHPLIYQEALARGGVTPTNALFVDDMQENIDAWGALGGHGIVYHSGRDQIGDLEEKFRSFGVLQ